MNFPGVRARFPLCLWTPPYTLKYWTNIPFLLSHLQILFIIIIVIIIISSFFLFFFLRRRGGEEGVGRGKSLPSHWICYIQCPAWNPACDSFSKANFVAFLSIVVGWSDLFGQVIWFDWIGFFFFNFGFQNNIGVVSFIFWLICLFFGDQEMDDWFNSWRGFEWRLRFDMAALGSSRRPLLCPKEFHFEKIHSM